MMSCATVCLHTLWGQVTISVSTKMRWATNCAEAVAHLHSRTPPLVHRDLKPQNILLTDGDTPTCKLVSLVWQPVSQACPAFYEVVCDCMCEGRFRYESHREWKQHFNHKGRNCGIHAPRVSVYSHALSRLTCHVRASHIIFCLCALL